MVSVTVKTPELDLTAVNDNNDQNNAEEFREEKGMFHSFSWKS